jgi:hypothetical protein
MLRQRKKKAKNVIQDILWRVWEEQMTLQKIKREYKDEEFSSSKE